MTTINDLHWREAQAMRWVARVISFLAAATWLLIMLDILLCEIVVGCITVIWETGLLVLLAVISVSSTAFAWRREDVGGLVMTVWGLIFTVIAYVTSHPYEIVSILMTGVPFMLAGGLFLASWWSRKTIPQRLANNHKV